MSKAVLLALAGLLAGCTDRGDCLQAHTVQVWYQPPPIYVQSGTVSIPIAQPGYFIDQQVCDQWQFPNGRPKQ